MVEVSITYEKTDRGNYVLRVIEKYPDGNKNFMTTDVDAAQSDEFRRQAVAALGGVMPDDHDLQVKEYQKREEKARLKEKDLAGPINVEETILRLSERMMYCDGMAQAWKEAHNNLVAGIVRNLKP